MSEIDGSVAAWRRRILRGKSLGLLEPSVDKRRAIAASLRQDLERMLATVASRGPGAHGCEKDLDLVLGSLQEIGAEALECLEDLVVLGTASPDPIVAFRCGPLLLEMRGWSVEAWRGTLGHPNRMVRKAALYSDCEAHPIPPVLAPLVIEMLRDADAEPWLRAQAEKVLLRLRSA